MRKKKTQKTNSLYPQQRLFRRLRHVVGAYAAWRLDRGLPITGRPLRFLARKVSDTAYRCAAPCTANAHPDRIFSVK